ncbi:putative chromatin remodeling & transcriptional activation CHROMO-DOMAIN family [Rosa chinensis]|uniref:Putative chromatin remodeling & transcriptional activation CHROMO-DOMAIN family n=1 Tax=Rosa chinensis TaxID=74649 RepID=A0A2P6RNR6_ROSCH|nr:putative chromatin remodeling & transcriptional activation CHROMO-DOMAIN family [Rosa chinensis]
MGNSSTDDSASDGDAPVFSEGEKVQKAELRKNEWKYFVHYLGWNKVWDEWVGVDRLLKHNEENIKKQQALNKKQDIITKSGRLTQMKPKSSTDAKMEKEEQKNNVAEGKKRKNDCGEDFTQKSGDVAYSRGS